ncbi:MAG: Uma2 family endonuclease [Bacillota bacterium]|jgi:Uma2 family endonuclease|nr:Uma2 family endonuclease [Bacillota bacterium]HQD19203.1 Uma2 family endonuclease [Bacillota bacterium]
MRDELELEILIEPGYRLELLAGQLVWDRPAEVAHQRCTRRLQRMLEEYFSQIDPRGEVLASVGFGPEDSFLLPDLIYISGEQHQLLRKAFITEAPTLVAEISSPSTREKDSILKFSICERARVQHFWLLDYAGQRLQCYALTEKGYALATEGANNDILHHPDFAGLSLELSALWPQGS